MRLLTLFLCIALYGNNYGQASRFNELIKLYGYNEFRWKDDPPTALQESKELVIPHFIYRDSLSVIQWKDIDSAGILGFANGNVRIVIYGRVTKYTVCDTTDDCKTWYFDKPYKVAGVSDSIFIPLKVKIHGLEPALTNKVTNRFRRMLHQLNNNTVTEHYSSSGIGQTVFYDRKTKAITICSHCSNSTSNNLTAKNLRNARKLVLNGILKVLSFELYIIQKGKPFHISNTGEDLNEECLQVLKTLQPSDSFIFDQVKVEGPDGSIRTIQPPGFIIQ